MMHALSHAILGRRLLAAGLLLTLSIAEQLPFDLDPRSSSLVVIGAHHFGRDANDPLYDNVKAFSWASVLLAEASPPVAAELQKMVLERNPTPHVPPARVHVLGQGVIPGNRTTAAPETLKFYTFDAQALPGLPFWATQIGSFNRFHVLKLLPQLAYTRSAARYPPRTLRKHIQAMDVETKPLAAMLRDAAVDAAGLMIIDTEGLDCAIVASQHWGSASVCRWRPSVLIFERSHCSSSAYAAARAALLGAAPCPPRPRRASATTKTKYVAVDERHDNGNNAAFALMPVAEEKGTWIKGSWLKWLGSASAESAPEPH
jgi:hypothetical protein